MSHRLGRFGFGLSYEIGGHAYSRTGLRESICRPVHAICVTKQKHFKRLLRTDFSKLKDISEVGRWRYVSFALNVGDDTSRGLSVKA